MSTQAHKSTTLDMLFLLGTDVQMALDGDWEVEDEGLALMGENIKKVTRTTKKTVEVLNNVLVVINNQEATKGERTKAKKDIQNILKKLA
jgi:hypothetical protein